MSKRRFGRNRPQDKSPRRVPGGGLDFTDLPEMVRIRGVWAQGRWLQALADADRLADRYPRRVLVQIDAARLNGALYRHGRAEMLLARLLEAAGGEPQVAYLAGQSYRLLRRPAAAIACLQAATPGPSGADAWLELALLQERRGELDAALESLAARRRKLGRDDEGEMLGGRIARRQGRGDDAEVALRGVAQRAGAAWLTRRRALCELAQVLDEEQRYAEAWEAMSASQRLARSHAAAHRRHRDRLTPPLLRMAAETTAESIARWSSESDAEPFAPLLLSGLPRSGTTLLADALDAHPGAVAADEYDVFPRLILPALFAGRPPEQLSSAVLEQLPQEHVATQRRAYRELLASGLGRSLDGLRVIDKNPSLLPLLTPYLRTVPQARLVIALRDPRDALVSCLLTYLPLNDFSVDFLELPGAVARLRSDLESWRTVRDKLPTGWREVRYEEFVADYRGGVEALCRFADLPPGEAPHAPRAQAADSVLYSPSYDKVRQPLTTSRVGRWTRYADGLQPVLGELNALAQQWGYPAD